MGLESCFDFIAEDAIRIKGTRIGIETVLGDYHLGAVPEEIVIRYPTLSLRQVYATITYYMENQPTLDLYLERVETGKKKPGKSTGATHLTLSCLCVNGWTDSAGYCTKPSLHMTQVGKSETSLSPR